MPIFGTLIYQGAITTYNLHYNRYLYSNEMELACGYQQLQVKI